MNRRLNSKCGGVDWLAARLGVSPSTIYAAMRRGDSLPDCLQIGTRKIWRAAAVERWLAEQEAPPCPDPRAAEKGSKGGRPRRPESRREAARRKIGRPTKQQQIEARK